MGCACLLKNFSSINNENNEIKEIEEDPEDLNNNNNKITNNLENQKENSQNEKEFNNNPDGKQAYVIQIGNQQLLNKNALALESNNNGTLNRAKSSPPLPKEDEDTKNLYKPIETNFMKLPVLFLLGFYL